MMRFLAEFDAGYQLMAGTWLLGFLAVAFGVSIILQAAVNCQQLFGKKDHLVKKTEMESAFDNFQRGADARQNENRRRLRRIEGSLDDLVLHLTGKLPRSLVQQREEEEDDRT